MHRRTSISLDCLTHDEIETRRRIGLVRDSVGEMGGSDHEYLWEAQEELDDSDEEARDAEGEENFNHKPTW